MAKFDYVLFDLDKTLFDFDASEKHSLKSTIENYGHSFNIDVLNLFQKINHALWDQYDVGEVNHTYVKYKRFERLFESLEIKADFEEAGDLYTSFLSECSQLTINSIEVCEKLAHHCKLAIVTNGFSSTQHLRINNSPIKDCFSNVFISDEIGSQKPNKVFFDFVFKEMGIINKERTIIIGDSIKTDITGGNLAGIKTCWFNPEKIENKTLIKCDYEIDSLIQLIDIII